MKPELLLDGRVSLYTGDCIEIMGTLPDNSIDSCVVDPPYHLTSIVKRFGAENAAPAKVGKTGAFARASRGFMGKQWDGGDIAFRPETWALVLRVLKPGGHLVAFSGTRTYHRMACAIEDAGFEIRDMLQWLYGSGFPKSHNVGKAIDETMFRRWLDADHARRAAYDSDVHAAKSIKRAERRAVAVDEVEAKWRTLAGCARDKIRVDASQVRNQKATGGGKDGAEGATRPWIEAALERGYHEKDGDEAATDEARAAEGWGTAFKPALEPICFARKPLIGTVAENFMAHGTGAINIDACRVDSPGGKLLPDGRWPANVIHDGSAEVVEAFPLAPEGEPSSSRFFYTAKADVDERLGSKHPTVKPTDLMQWLVRSVTPKGGVVLDCFAGTGTTGEAAWREGMRAVLIEREPEYQEDIRRRMSLVLGGPEERHRVAMKPREKSVDELPLFGGSK
jgi:DNA modification methylase